MRWSNGATIQCDKPSVNERIAANFKQVISSRLYIACQSAACRSFRRRVTDNKKTFLKSIFRECRPKIFDLMLAVMYKCKATCKMFAIERRKL